MTTSFPKLLKNPVIHIRNLSKRYGPVLALDNISFDVERGALFGLLGPNGAGKTTILRILLGLVLPDSGHYTILGLDPIKNHAKIYSRVGYVPEDPRLPEFMTGKSFLMFVGELYGLSKGDRERRASELLELAGLADVTDKKIGGYSKGMVQRLTIAHALIGEPELLIMDEPTLGMDPEGKVYFRGLFKKLSKEGITSLLSSHMLKEVEKTCTHTAIINNGRVLATGDLSDIRESFTDRWRVKVELAKPLPSLERRLSGLGCVDEARVTDGTKLNITLSNKIDCRHKISEMIADSGGIIVEMRLIKKSLEEAYLEAIRSGV